MLPAAPEHHETRTRSQSGRLSVRLKLQRLLSSWDTASLKDFKGQEQPRKGAGQTSLDVPIDFLTWSQSCARHPQPGPHGACPPLGSTSRGAGPHAAHRSGKARGRNCVESCPGTVYFTRHDQEQLKKPVLNGVYCYRPQELAPSLELASHFHSTQGAGGLQDLWAINGPHVLGMSFTDVDA